MIVPEYTFLSIAILIGFALAVSSQKIFEVRKRAFRISFLLAFLVLILADNWAAQNGFWIFDGARFSKFLVPFVPIEMVVIGLAMFLATVFFFENISPRRKTPGPKTPL